uniref:Uncharacterized protein n=1 Tax=Alexandrium andersonii TaxID=327968 RepID=A0A7S2DYQ0_9DINO
MTDALAVPSALPPALAGRQLVVVLPRGAARPSGFEGVPVAVQSQVAAEDVPSEDKASIEGDITGNDGRKVKVRIHGWEEDIYINGSEGPIWMSPQLQPQNGHRGTGRWQMTVTRSHGHEGTKHWSDMTKTERELIIARTAKHNHAYRVYGYDLPEFF